MKRLEGMKENLMSVVQGQLCDIHNVDAQELGAAIDMIKDLSEAIYYCTIIKAMEEGEEEKEEHKEKREYPRYYPVEYPIPVPMPMDYRQYSERDMDRGMGRMYYNGDGNSGGSSGGNSGGGNSGGSSSGGSSRQYPVYMDMRDEREGRSAMTRRTYMESKEMHKDKKTKMHELEKYMKELTDDMIEMIEDASPEEKDLLEKRVAGLANKLAQI